MSAEPVTAPGEGAVLNTRLDAVFNPASVAIYGISDRTSGRIAENMTVPGVPFYGVNPTKTEACGVRCYPSMAACPTVPEMVVMGVGHRRIEAAVDDVLSVEGVRAVITPGLGNEGGVAPTNHHGAVPGGYAVEPALLLRIEPVGKRCKARSNRRSTCKRTRFG